VGRWELAVLDLESGQERVLPDTAGIDDQAAWLDAGTLAYGAISGSTGKSSVYQVPADGSGKPSLVATEASSPVPMP
jgi:Tol biopolymer transport system component